MEKTRICAAVLWGILFLIFPIFARDDRRAQRDAAGASAGASFTLEAPGALVDPVMWIPENGPATGSGQPCQVFAGNVSHKPGTPGPSYHWIEPHTLQDGDCVGMLRVRDGRVQPCP